MNTRLLFLARIPLLLISFCVSPLYTESSEHPFVAPSPYISNLSRAILNLLYITQRLEPSFRFIEKEITSSHHEKQCVHDVVFFFYWDRTFKNQVNTGGSYSHEKKPFSYSTITSMALHSAI